MIDLYPMVTNIDWPVSKVAISDWILANDYQQWLTCIQWLPLVTDLYPMVTNSNWPVSNGNKQWLTCIQWLPTVIDLYPMVTNSDWPVFKGYQ
jgi:hypothetical protein